MTDVRAGVEAEAEAIPKQLLVLRGIIGVEVEIAATKMLLRKVEKG